MSTQQDDLLDYFLQHGSIVEEGSAQDIFRMPKHPYTQALLAAAPGRHQDFGSAAAAC